ncbi:hypothetical protein CSV71_02145 [Sporosarcina sp. P21c]|uniref:hypothetical protein n=1 Tax=Sporosarcina sp. P21c TaxID=2048255 RepID=UPI000C167DCB|nr:hypothetical protein [Sporosarcina sp. P21c]PIC90881.1 hypothetical protein CSV71_02145 [Sporosarcina sp. P21c]
MIKQGNEGVLISREVQWFVDTLRKDYGIRVTAREVGYEGLKLGKDEVDEVFIPTELFEIIPTTSSMN